MNRTTSETVPLACLLDGGDLEDRVAWIADVNRRALLGSKRDGLRLELTYAEHALEDVRELMRREQQCCAFLDFQLLADGDVIRLIVTAPDEAREGVELVFEPFQSEGADASFVSCGRNPSGTR